MALTDAYVQIYGQLPEVFAKLAEGEAPAQFTIQHLKDLGYTSSNYRALIPLLKALGFLDASGRPSQRYHDYRNGALSRTVMSQALREAYSDIFTLKSRPSDRDKALVQGKFKSTHNSSENTAKLMANTFFALLGLADLDSSTGPVSAAPLEVPSSSDSSPNVSMPAPHGRKATSPHYNIQIHLPATKDLEVYSAIFKSLKEHLLD